jgi:hypothetical protein
MTTYFHVDIITVFINYINTLNIYKVKQASQQR